MEDSGSKTDAPPATRGRSRLWKWTRRILLTGLVGAVLAIAAGVGTYLYFERDLPSVEALRTYQPPQVTKVYCAGGDLCAEYYNERRTWVDIATLPPHVKNAFLAAEDADFYKHEGLDYVGMARALVMGLLPGRRLTGASTITQQAVKNLLLTHERSASRKIREWILTPRVEQTLTKDQILALYVNQIYFGHNRYGIEEAAVFYFGKHAKDLTIGEAAVLGGTPQLPHRINPLTNIVKAKRRQQYVLTQLARHGFLPEEVVKKEMDKPIVLAPPQPDPVGPYYTEEIRRLLLARYGEKALFEGGMRVDIAMDVKLQAMADTALREGLEAVDRRMGYQGPVGKLSAEDFAAVRPHIVQRIEEAGKRRKDEILVADVEPLVASAPATDTPADEDGAEEKPAGAEGEETPASPQEIRAREVRLRPLKQDLRLAGFVTQVDDVTKKATVDLVGRTAEISFGTISWARPRGVGKWTKSPTKISEVLSPGMVVKVKVTRVTPAPQPLEATLDQTPEVQGALVVIDPANRHVVALTGGYDFARSSFNRATQAKRQPGSAFKPFLYAAAISSHQYTTITQVNDAPEAIRDAYTDKTWKPKNYEVGSFDGPMTLRAALTKSKNTVSVRLIEKLTPQAAIDFARRAGIRSDLPDNLTLALGTGEVKVLELTNAYATLSSMGQYADPILLVRVTDRTGKVLEEHQAAFEETMQPSVAYVATSMMRSVVEEGTATAVKELRRPAAGKTGTASEYRDAWFAGYTRDFVASAWVGFDDHSMLGRETGGSAALPIWMGFMREAHQNLPEREFDPPPGVELVRIDPVTGLLAGDAVPGRIEPFLQGTAPTAMAPPPGQVTPDQFFFEDSRRGGM